MTRVSPVTYFSNATSTFIVRVSRDHYRLVWAALSFTTKLPPGAKPCVMRVVRVSGTIRKAEEEAIRRARDSAFRAQQALNSVSAVGIPDVDMEDAAIISLRGPRAGLPAAVKAEVLIDGSDDDGGSVDDSDDHIE